METGVPTALARPHLAGVSEEDTRGPVVWYFGGHPGLTLRCIPLAPSPPAQWSPSLQPDKPAPTPSRKTGWIGW